MKTYTMVYHILRADFLERVRSYGFLVLLLFTIFVTYLFIPDIHSIQILGLNLGGFRAVYNSAWVGSMTALLMGEFFPLFSFYLLKGSIERDRRTGVGQILAATPMTKVAYMFGKWLSNILVVGTMIIAIIAAAVLLQLIRAEDTHVDLWALVAPFIIVLFPALTIIAGAAVLFDSFPAFSGGIGNVIFFMAYILLFLPFDPQGNAIIYPSIYHACSAAFTGCIPYRQIDAGMSTLINYPTFHYSGVDWTPSIVLSRFSLILIGAVLTFLATWFFQRFDPAKLEKSIKTAGNISARFAFTAQVDTIPVKPTLVPSYATLTALQPAAHLKPFSSLMQRLLAELHLLFKGVRWIWFLAAFGTMAASALTSLEIAHLYLLPVALVLPLTIWSNLGVREVRYRVEQIVFSAPYVLKRQLPMTWLAGVVVALVLTSPITVRLGLAHEWSALVALAIGIFFVPTLAMALGCWSNGSKLFEGGYLFFWYLASLHGVPAFDFMGRIPAAREQGIPLIYLSSTVLLMAITTFGRKRQMVK